MNLWIRVDACASRDPKVAQLAQRLGVSIPTALGHLVMLWGVMAEHTPDGVLEGVGVNALEQWSGWSGKRGKFDAAFREIFVSDGKVGGWEKRQGALVRHMERDRERKHRGNSVEIPANSTLTERNGTERNEQSVVGGEVVGIVIGQPADYAVAITIAANNAIRARWGEQTRVLVHGASYELTRDLQEAGIPLDVARASIVDQVERSSKATPPSTINWFRPGILASHAEQQQRALMGEAPPTIQKRMTKTEQALRAIEGL